MQPSLILSQATAKDLPLMKQLFVDTIHNVCAKDYNEAQRKVWAATVNNEERWTNLIEQQYVVLVYDKSDLAAFASLTPSGYIDFFYVSKDHQGQGIASLLLQHLEEKALEAGLTMLSSEVSLTAKGFFEKKGFKVLEQQWIPRAGVTLTNFRVQKPLQ